MKSVRVTVLVAIAALAAGSMMESSSVALAQPGATPARPAAGSGAGSGSGSGSGAASGSAAGSGSGSASSPSWLPGLPGGDTNDLSDIKPAVDGSGTVVLTMDQAVALGLEQQPTLKAAVANIDIAGGHVDQARATLRPTITLGAGLGIATSPVYNCNGFNTVTMTNGSGCSGGFFLPTGTLNLSGTAAWKITDFGQTRELIRADEATQDSQVDSLDSSKLDVRLNVESAYLQAVAYQRLVVVARSTLKSTDDHLDQAKRFVKAGQQDPITVAQAQAAESNAKSALALSQSNYAVALSTLRSAIGWVDPKQAPVVDPHWPIPPDQDPPDLASLVGEARKHRPDIAAQDKLIEAGQDSLKAADDEHRPVLSAQASLAWAPNTATDGNAYFGHDYNIDHEPTWAVGLNLSWLVFSGGKIAADVRVANASLQLAIANRDALLVTLTSQIEGARSQIGSNREAVAAANEAVVAAREQLKLSDARYTNGIGSQIELADAETAVTTAEGNLVQSQYQLALAWAQLRRYIGQAQ